MDKISEWVHEIDAHRVPDATRRAVLLGATAAMGGAGLIAASVPFVASLQPSAVARARGGPVDVAVGGLAAGELRTVEWRGKPVWLMRRTDAMVRALQLPNDEALNAELHAPGGFLCPCHGSRFDLAGRVVKNVPAPTNLDIPDYRFTSATTLRIG